MLLKTSSPFLGFLSRLEDSVEKPLWYHWNLPYPAFVWQLNIYSKQIRFWHGLHRPDFQRLKWLTHLRLPVTLLFNFSPMSTLRSSQKKSARLSWTCPAFGTCLTPLFNWACQNVNEDPLKSASRLNKVFISCRSKFNNLFTWHVSTFPATLPQFLFLSGDRACLVVFCLIFLCAGSCAGSLCLRARLLL